MPFMSESPFDEVRPREGEKIMVAVKELPQIDIKQPINFNSKAFNENKYAIYKWHTCFH